MSAAGGFTRLLEVETPESVSFTYELADIGSRVLAASLDLLLIGLLLLAEIVVALLGNALLSAVTGQGLYLFSVWVLAVLIGAAFITFWGYFLYGEVVRNGQTWGKRRLGLRVVREDGSRVSFVDVVIRNLLRMVDLLPGNYALGIATIVFDRSARRVGDIAAGTVVIRDAGAYEASMPVGHDPERVELARDYLARRGALTPEGRTQVGVAVLRAFGEESGRWDEPMIAGRIADLTGLR